MSMPAARVSTRTRYNRALEIARHLLEVNNTPDVNLRREVIIALRSCGPMTTCDLLELLVVALDSGDELEVIAAALRQVNTR